MAQHFLLSSKARTLSLKQIYKMSDDEVFEHFQNSRWEDGKAICPECGHDKSYFLAKRKTWKCADCYHFYTVTSGTIFSSHKLPLQDYLAAIAIMTNTVKNISALQLSRDLGVQYKTAFVLAHKIREAMITNENQEKLSGEIEMDGAYFGGYVKPENKAKDRKNLSLYENLSGKRKCVVVMRERSKEEKKGAVKTRTFVMSKEAGTPILMHSIRNVEKGSFIYTDEHKSYTALDKHYNHLKTNHLEMYSSNNGTNSNQAESYFSRLRRAEIGQHHHISNKYLHAYAAEIAYREDTRKIPNGEIFNDISNRTMKCCVSETWCGYWQRSILSNNPN